MTIRAVPCPLCLNVPETKQSGDQAVWYTACTVKRCKNNLYCLGKTEDESKACWNGRIDEGDY